MAKITIEYCSKYNSYNGDKVTEGKVLAPVMISRATTRSSLRTSEHGSTTVFRSG